MNRTLMPYILKADKEVFINSADTMAGNILFILYRK